MKTKKILASFIAIALSSITTYAADNFSLTEVKVTDKNTLNVIFNNTLLEDTSLFDFLLTPKSDDTKEVALTGITLSSPNSLSIKTVEDLMPNTEYNLTVVFVSDKDGKTIENGVDGMLNFTTPNTFSTVDNSGTLNEVMTPGNEVNMNNEVNKEPTTENNELNAATVTTETTTSTGNLTNSGVSVETASSNAEKLPQTGPKEIIVVILALTLGLGAMYIRRKA
ncbi:hypothetical protein H3C61_03280 [Candidatus Gracilibacteria bacterium]|nr:hypothetical protein [Candidatus Gracilibacteria bacterium]